MMVKFIYSNKRIMFLPLTKQELRLYIKAAPNLKGYNNRLKEHEEVVKIVDDKTDEVYWSRYE